MILTIAYLTFRKEPMAQWFFDSLANQCGNKYDGIQVVVIDFWSQPVPYLNWTQKQAQARKKTLSACSRCPDVVVSPPKPTPWNGPYRLTKNDYFAAANARNTAICLAKGDYIVFVDDLSVALPTWLSAVREGMEQKRILCGAFRKVNKLNVRDGAVVYFEDHKGGHDMRWNEGRETEAVKCFPNWLFGCSFAAPMEALLQVNGLCEDADSTGVGMEDCALGEALAKHGHQLWYDRRMLTYESEERHHSQDHKFLRHDKKRGGVIQIAPGVSHPNEKGHHFVRIFRQTKRFPNYFGEEGIAGLRQRVLNGEPFSTAVIPEHDWWDGQALSEL